MASRTPLLLRGLTGDPAEGHVILTHREVFGRRLYANSLIRAGLAIVFVVGAIVAHEADLIDPRRVRSLVVLGLFMAAYDLPLFLVGRRFREPEASANASDRLRYVMAAAIIADFFVLALMVNVMGGARSPYMAFYLPHVAMSSVLLYRRDAVFFTALAILLVVIQVVLETTGLRAPTFPLLGEEQFPPMRARTAFEIVGVYASLLVLTAVLLVSVVDRLRSRERDLRIANERLDRLSRLRRDFLDIAVHDMRSPVGASLMLLNNLGEGLAGPLQPVQQDWVDRSRLRLERLLTLLHDIETLGDLESDDPASTAIPVSMQTIVEQILDDYGDQAQAAGLHLTIRPHARHSEVMGVPRLLHEAVANLVTNAIRHAAGSGAVFLSTERIVKNGRPWIRTSVSDHGPGIPEEGREGLFAAFSGPARTIGRDGTRGTGLGLSIVRRVVEAHGGEVGLESRPGRGCTFFLDLPALEPSGES